MPKYNRDEYPANSIVYERTCPYCQQDFWGNKPSATYCSDKCRVYANKAKRETGESSLLSAQTMETQGRKGMKPMVVQTGKYQRLVYYNPFQEKLKALDPDNSFGKKHLSGERVRTLEEVIAYHTLRLQSHHCYFRCIKELLEEDMMDNETVLSDSERYFLQNEQFKVDMNIVGVSRRIQNIRLKSSDPAYVPW